MLCWVRELVVGLWFAVHNWFRSKFSSHIRDYEGKTITPVSLLSDLLFAIQQTFLTMKTHNGDNLFQKKLM